MLKSHSEPSQEWMNLLCREWRRTSSPVLAQLIQQGRYMASTPPRLVVMSGLLAGRGDDLLTWVQSMSFNGNESTIQSLNREQLMASLDVLLHHKRWEELVDFTGKMFCTIDMEFWRDFVSRVADSESPVLLRIAERCPPKMAQSCLKKLKEIQWQSGDEKLNAFLSAMDGLLDDPGQPLYPIPFRPGKNLVIYQPKGFQLSVQNSSLAVDPPLSQSVSVTAAKTFKGDDQAQRCITFWSVGPFHYESEFTVSRFEQDRYCVHLDSLEMGIEGTVISVKWESRATYSGNRSINFKWKTGQYSESLIVDLLSRVPPHLVTEKELLQLQQAIPQIQLDKRPHFPEFVINMIYWSQCLSFRKPGGTRLCSNSGRYKLLEDDELSEVVVCKEERNIGQQ